MVISIIMLVYQRVLTILKKVPICGKAVVTDYESRDILG